MSLEYEPGSGGSSSPQESLAEFPPAFQHHTRDFGVSAMVRALAERGHLVDAQLLPKLQLRILNQIIADLQAMRPLILSDFQTLDARKVTELGMIALDLASDIFNDTP